MTFFSRPRQAGTLLNVELEKELPPAQKNPERSR